MAAYSLSKTMIVTIFFSVLFLPPFIGSVPLQELHRALSALHYRGHSLFANAISTSDLFFDLLTAEFVTLLCPTDSLLFALDMTQSLPFYVATLRLSAIPRRLTLSDLRFLPNASSIPTLVPSHSLLVTRPSADPAAAVDLEGVQILLPDLYTSRHVAVHGVAAVLPFRYAVTATSSPVPSVAGTVSLPVSAPSGPNFSAAPLGFSASPSSSMTLPSQAPAINGPSFPPREADPWIFAPAPDRTFHGIPPTYSPMISPDSAPDTVKGSDNRKPSRFAKFSFVQLALSLGMHGGKEDTNSEPLVMETSEF